MPTRFARSRRSISPSSRGFRESSFHGPRGESIGPEIVREAERVLDVLADEGLPIERSRAAIGGAGHDTAGHPLPPATLELAEAADAVLLGAVGGPRYDALPRELRPEQGILVIR